MASFGNGVIQEDEDLTSAGRDYLPQVIVTPLGTGILQADEDLTLAGRDYLPQVVVTPLGSGAIQDLDNRFLVTRSNPTS